MTILPLAFVAQINRRAPAVGIGGIEIAASPEIVWEVLTALDRWTTWNPDVTEVTVQGPLAEGTEFRWKKG